MRRFTERLTRLERRNPPSGLLPTVVAVPDAEPHRSRVLADIERRRARGQTIVAVREGEDKFAALVEVFAP